MRFTIGKNRSCFGQRRVPAQHWRGADVIRWIGRRRRLALGLANQSEVHVRQLSSCHFLENASTLSSVPFVSKYTFLLFRGGAYFRRFAPILGLLC